MVGVPSPVAAPYSYLTVGCIIGVAVAYGMALSPTIKLAGSVVCYCLCLFYWRGPPSSTERGGSSLFPLTFSRALKAFITNPYAA